MGHFDEFYCDMCGETVAAKDAYVVWKSNGLQARNFKIIHQKICDDKSFMGSESLGKFLGVDGLAYLLTFLSCGRIIEISGKGSFCKIENDDMEEFVDFFRRVQSPFYEKARRRFNNTNILDSLSDANQMYPYQSKILKEIANEEI